MSINQDVERSLQLKTFAKNRPKWGVSREVECCWFFWYYSLWTLLIQKVWYNTGVVSLVHCCFE